MTSFTNSAYPVQPIISGLGARRRADTPVLKKVLALLNEVPALLRQAWTAYQTREQLSRLSDRALGDIGIGRDDIPTVSRQVKDQGIIRHGDLGTLLAMNDNELASIGLQRRDLEDFRAGRVKFVRRHNKVAGGQQ